MEVAPQQLQLPLASARSSTTRVAIDDDMQIEDTDPAPEPEPVPQTSLTFLLIDGRRRTMAFDPTTTVGRVKELVWNAWPSGASSFALLSLS
ncbi:hypothetical protein B0H12DRAFT_1100364 [Mycena haematopus]|nr:hypothetical protein B0H12DRAFT_1100364 [Mycena haematopus]